MAVMGCIRLDGGTFFPNSISYKIQGSITEVSDPETTFSILLN